MTSEWRKIVRGDAQRISISNGSFGLRNLPRALPEGNFIRTRLAVVGGPDLGTVDYLFGWTVSVVYFSPLRSIPT